MIPPQSFPPDLTLGSHPALSEYRVLDVRRVYPLPHGAAAVAVYSGTLAVTAVFFTTLWFYAAGHHRLVDRAIDPLLLRAMRRSYVFGMLLYILAFALAFFSAAASLALIAILALIFVLPEPKEPGSSRRNRRPPIRD
jgi:hypothetical protein